MIFIVFPWFSWVSYGFPMVFLWFLYDFHGFPMGFPWFSDGLTSPTAYPPSGWKLLHFALPIRCQAHRDHPDLEGAVRCGFSFGIKNGRYKIYKVL